MKRLAIASVLLGGLLSSCSEMPSAPSFTAFVTDPVLIGAGDIANCSSPGAALTASLLDVTDGTVFTAGDNAYMTGSYQDYMRCYEPHWGRHKGRTLPTPGNHEYETTGAQGYYQYYGDRAGPPGLGYYSVTLGRWLVIVLNSSVDASASSAQLGWLRSTLQQFHGRCVAAIWHHPVVSSGPNGGSPEMFEAWRILHAAGADVVLTGHEHLYRAVRPARRRAAAHHARHAAVHRGHRRHHAGPRPVRSSRQSGTRNGLGCIEVDPSTRILRVGVSAGRTWRVPRPGPGALPLRTDRDAGQHDARGFPSFS